MRILVTGSSGFIGTNLCESLLLDGFEVVGVDSLTENYSTLLKKKNTEFLRRHAKFVFHEEDLLSSNLSELFSNIDVVCHLAGQPSVHNSWGVDFGAYSQRNIVLTQKLLQAARESDVAKFVNSSSSSVYGTIMNGKTKESDEKNPISPYGVTKLAAENLVTLYGSEFNLQTVSLRYFTVYGPRQRPDMAFSKLISSALEGKPFPLHGDGSQIRDFTFVGDVVDAIKLAAFKDVNAGAVFNIGGGNPTSMSSAIEIIESLLNRSIKIHRQSFGPGNPKTTSADCSKAAELLGWKPKVNITEGLIEQCKWVEKS
jgi:nucleoside-diphosphate-sugar epimerase